ncbi:lectin BRA-3-like [Gadus macrocephalus]|uniref:lectin BRA-3-like n=1 Tax=Gadus macrocephalus TaxID=80720 RepID=UPI0028CB2C4F|nr:lectin BRA-3-like [Gadus macrocephalus]
MDMSAARDYCRTHHTDLVSIRSAAENQEVREVAAGHEVWIGLFKDTWRWSDERYSSFRFWKLNVYTAYTLTTICGFVDLAQTGEWGLSDCGLKRPFLCTCTKTRVLKVKVRSEDLQDMSDPATKAAILKQMQQLVDKATMPGGHKMIWRTKPDGQVFTREQCHQEDCDSLN